MVTPREPDRFDAQARDVGRQIDGAPWPDTVAIIAAAFRAEHASALERAAQEFTAESVYSGYAVSQRLRALIPPAAAPAAKDFQPASEQDSQNTSADAQVEGARSAGSPTPLRGTASGPSLPAAETGKAEAPDPESRQSLIRKWMDERNAVIAAEAILRECEEFVRWMIRAEGSKWDEARSDALLAKLAARAAPTDGEGK